MSETVRNYLKNYCQNHAISPRTLERQAGTGVDSIYEFLVGRRSDIKLSTALKIADTLSISLDELVDRKNFLEKFIPVDKHKGQINQDIFKQVVAFIIDFIAESDKQYSFKEVVYSINELYDYMIDNNLKVIDKTFSKWFCTNKMQEL